MNGARHQAFSRPRLAAQQYRRKLCRHSEAIGQAAKLVAYLDNPPTFSDQRAWATHAVTIDPRGLCRHAIGEIRAARNGRNECTPDPAIGNPRSEGTEFTGLEQLVTQCTIRAQARASSLQSVIEALVAYVAIARASAK